MRKILLVIILLTLSTSAFAWGSRKPDTKTDTSTKKTTKKTDEKPDNNVNKKTDEKPDNNVNKKTDEKPIEKEGTSDSTNTGETPLTDEERKFLIINKLKTSEPTALDVYSDGKTVDLNIPIGNYTLIYFDDIIDEITYIKGSGLEIIADSAKAAPTKFIKVQSTSATLRNLDVQIKLRGDKWHKFTFRTSLKDKRYSKINIISNINANKNMEELKEKYFKKDVQVKEVSKMENLKAIRLILDRITLDTKRHFAQLEIEEKIHKIIIDHSKTTGLVVTLDTAVAEAYKIVGGIHESKEDVAIEKEIILLNLVLENKGNSVFILTETIVTQMFKNFIAFYYDKNHPTIAPHSKLNLTIVVEDHRLNKQLTQDKSDVSK